MRGLRKRRKFDRHTVFANGAAVPEGPSNGINYLPHGCISADTEAKLELGQTQFKEKEMTWNG